MCKCKKLKIIFNSSAYYFYYYYCYLYVMSYVNCKIDEYGCTHYCILTQTPSQKSSPKPNAGCLKLACACYGCNKNGDEKHVVYSQWYKNYLSESLQLRYFCSVECLENRKKD